MTELGTLTGLRTHILLLLATPALVLGCTSKSDANEPKTKGAKVSTQVEATPTLDPVPSTPTSDAVEAPAVVSLPPTPAPLPEGASFCFAPEQAEAAALAGSSSQDDCPVALDPTLAREHTDAWSSRTGGPWNIRVPLVTDDAPEGTNARCCYAQKFSRVPGTRPTRGRPLIVDSDRGERVLVPELAACTGDDGWLADAQVELASVAAFARANLELLQLGAPPHLIRANLQAARDELEHARICLERGNAAGPLGPLEPPSPRPTTVTESATRTLLEACIPETLGTLAAARLAARARADGRMADAAARDQIAEDEARHAALAWATLRWVRSQDPVAVDARLRELLPQALETVRVIAAAEPALDERDAPTLWAQLIQPLS